SAPFQSLTPLPDDAAARTGRRALRALHVLREHERRGRSGSRGQVEYPLLIQGEALDGDLSGKLMASAKSDDLPFYVLTTGNLAPPKAGEADPLGEQRFASPDALLSPSCVARAAHDPAVRIEPAWKVSLVYGMPCAIYHMLPAAYYLAARFSDDFESGVLHALNGGGQNQIRAMLTGSLIGAQTGIDGIPARFIDGLTDRKALLPKALALGTIVSDAAQKTQ
ncbi:MAG: ADP-ribosylglycohydrolase family protein, partial [Rhizobiales bacterium]|nr:ADP-ribosylglycohydrolase family protein [Hyphomicrobiales bacterium]